MLYKTLCAILHKGDRVEKGKVIDLTAEDVKRLDPSEISPVADVEVAPVIAEPEKPLEEMTAAELKDKAAALELSTSGTKADLLERITLHLAGGEEASDEETDEQEN